MSHWKQARWPFVVFVLIEVVIFGSGSAVTKFAYDSITPLWCLAVRFGLATVVFALFFGRRIIARLRSVKVRLWLPQALCMGISYLCCNVALDLTTATNVGFLVALPVVFAPLLSDGGGALPLSARHHSLPGGSSRRSVPFCAARAAASRRGAGRAFGFRVVGGAGRRARVRQAGAGRA
ncbi:MAG: EamA family transporter [Adlercreutzia equolifaciens]